MARPHFGDAVEKEFAETIRGLAHRHETWRIWSDAMNMMAISLSNAVDTRHREKREEQYLSIVKAYSQDEVQAFPKLFALIVQAMETNPDQDFLGKMYMQLELSNKWKGQFFTPFHVSKMMAEMQMADAQELIDRQGWLSVCDNCVGAGGMLIAAVSACRKHNINYHDHVMFVGQDIDQIVAMMAYIQISLLGCPGYIKVGNSLSDPMTGPVLFGEDSENMWFTPFYFKDTWHHRRLFSMMDAMIGKHTDRTAQAAEVEESIQIGKPEGMFFFFFDQEAM